MYTYTYIQGVASAYRSRLPRVGNEYIHMYVGTHACNYGWEMVVGSSS